MAGERRTALNYLPILQSPSSPVTLESLVTLYFGQGYTNLEIISFLAVHHNHAMSLSTLKRLLSRLGLRRRFQKDVENRREITDIIKKEVFEGSGSSLGYRKIWSIVKSMGMPAKRSTVMEILKEVDPVGVECRKKRRLKRRIYSVPGPDHLWHIDGFDKLKPYGFSIHGCIDGFSRRILWLEVGRTNKMPEVIAYYFLRTIKQLKGVPTRIRSDAGTENSIIEAIQIALRSVHSDEYSGLGSFVIGSSPANQKIECLWSQFQKDRVAWWRDFFKEMVNADVLDASNPVIAECVRYCFMHLLRKDLDDFLQRWNRHILAPSTNSLLPRGRPDALYFVPEMYSCKSHQKQVDLEEVREFEDPRFSFCALDNCEEFVEFAETVLAVREKDSTHKPQTIQEALELYFILLEDINKHM